MALNGWWFLSIFTALSTLLCGQHFLTEIYSKEHWKRYRRIRAIIRRRAGRLRVVVFFLLGYEFVSD